MFTPTLWSPQQNIVCLYSRGMHAQNILDHCMSPYKIEEVVG